MPRNLTYREALNEALAQEMERDPSVIVMGEDNAGGEGAPGEDDAWGGVLGVTALPPNMYRNFAAWLKIWSKQTPMKSTNISSATGRIPAVAAPIAAPMNADSEMGVSRTRPGNLW